MGIGVHDNANHNISKNKKSKQEEISEYLAELLSTLEDVDENDKLATLNESSISDNNGGRIVL